MTTIREWLTRLWGTVRPARRDDDLEQELRAHLALAAEDESRRHASPDAAAREARRRWGAVTAGMDALRDQRGLPWLADLGRDAVHAARSCARQPVFATAVLVTLAVGIGANTLVFSLVNSVLLKPLGYPEPDRLVAVWHTAPGAPGLADVSGDLRLSPSMYFTYAGHNRAFEQIGLWQQTLMTVTGVAEPEQVRVIIATDGTLQALGVPPAVGRWPAPGEYEVSANDTLVLTHGYWRRRFGGDRSAVGRTIAVDGRPRTIVGVMPERFRVLDTDADLILPLAFDRGRLTLPGFGYQALARLRPGVSIAEANADVARMLPIWMASWPAAPGANPRVYEDWRITPALRPLHQDVVGHVGGVLWLLMGTVGLVLLIACANVANLMLVRTESRRTELAIRASLGAGRGRIVRALLIESVSLAVLGGAIGVALAFAGLRVVVAMAPANVPRLAEIAIDARALGVTLLAALACGLAAGLVPALKHAGPRLSDGLRDASRGATDSRERHRVRSTLAVVQVSLAMVLLVGSGLLLRSFLALRAVDPGFTDAAQLQTFRVSIPAGLVREPERVARAQQAMVEALSAIPGVSAVGFASAMHMEGIPANWDLIQAEGQNFRAGNERPPLRVFKSVSPSFFATTGTALRAGRDYTWTDLWERRPFVVVSENVAREIWGSPEAAVGRRIRTLESAPWREVIGVVQDVFDNGVHDAAPSIVYWPTLGESYYRAGPTFVMRSVTFALRSDRAGSETLGREIERAVWTVNGHVSVASVRTLGALYDRSMARTSFTLAMLVVSGAMALVLGLVGLSGVIAYTVSRRTREIGIRLAVGARQGALVRMFLAHAVTLAVAGIGIGMVAAAALTRVMSSLLYGVTPLDPITYAVVPVSLLAASALAGYLPARRAAAIDPVAALKAE